MKRLLQIFLVLFVLLPLASHWVTSLPNTNPFIIYFGRPRDIITYLSLNWEDLAYRTGECLLTALLSLVLTGLSAVLLLALGLIYDGWLAPIERLAAASQTIPVLVIVIATLIVETSVSASLNISAPIGIYCLGPVTLGLLFPPLVCGADAVLRLPIEIKALLRLWNAPTRWRILHVYLPAALPSIMTGMRSSATWAVSATLIAEGMFNGVDGDSSTLGHFLIRPFSSGAPGRTPTVMIVSTALGFGVYYAFVCIQGIVEKWLLGSVGETVQSYPLQSKR